MVTESNTKKQMQDIRMKIPYSYIWNDSDIPE